MKKILIFVLLASVFISCKKQEANQTNNGTDLASISDLSARESKLYFAKTLAKAVSEDPVLRAFIRTEALKEFDHDYDVFYQSVKNVTLSDGETFEYKVQKHAESKDIFIKSIKQLPLLTIMIPEIADVSAQKWNTSSEIPLIGVEPENASNKESVKCFYGQSEQFEIPYGSVPSTIALVVKDNERILVESSSNLYAKGNAKNSLMSIQRADNTKNSNTFLAQEGMRFSFADEVFNNIDNASEKMNPSISKSLMAVGGIRPLSGPRPGGNGTNPPVRPGDGNTTFIADDNEVQRIVDAKESGTEWVRDYIYYGIKPGTDRGPLKRNIKECLTYMRFINPNEAFGVIGQNPGDPQPVNNTQIAQEWTNGSYEFRLTVLINTKNGPSAEVHHTFYVKPSSLFLIGYKRGGHVNGGPREPLLEPYIGAAHNYKLPVPLPIAGWDLENVSFGWQVYLLKYNNQSTVTSTVTTTNSYASNFEFSPSLGEKIKIGPKFGGSATTTNTNTYQLARIFGSSDFGDAILNYSDPIFISYEKPGKVKAGSGRETTMPGTTSYKPYEILLGSVYLTFEPRAVF